MNQQKSEFAEGVRAQARATVPVIASSYIEKAIQDYRSKGWTEMHHELPCLHLADELQRSHKSKNILITNPVTPALKIETEALTKFLKKGVEATRIALFGSKRPKFRTQLQAAEWIRTSEKAQQTASESELKLARSLQTVAAKQMRAAARLLKCGYRVGFDLWGLPHIHPKERFVTRVRVMAGSPLEVLASHSLDLSAQTGFPQEQIVQYILTGIRPTLPPGQVSVTDMICGGIHRTSVTITLSSRDLTFSQLRCIYRQMRASMSMTRSKPIKNDDQAFLRLVEKMGGEPRGIGRQKFWTQFYQEWNKQMGKKQYAMWRGPAQRFRRLQKRLA